MHLPKASALLTVVLFSGVAAGLSVFGWTPAQEKTGSFDPGQFARSIAVDHLQLDTKTYLEEAWALRGRAGFTSNSNLVWDTTSRQWTLRSKLQEETETSIAEYASSTEPAGRLALNLVQTYHDSGLIDELAKFYSAFLKTHFTTLGQLRKLGGPQSNQKLLGPEQGPDWFRTMPWYTKQQDGSDVPRDCYLCNSYYFYHPAQLVRVVAELQSSKRTSAMTQFVAEYVPLLVKEHVLRGNLVGLMRQDMDPKDRRYKKLPMRDDEVEVVATAAEVLGAHEADPKLVAIEDSDVKQLKDLVSVGVDLFQFSRTLRKDADGTVCASYFNGDWDGLDDMAYSGYRSEKFPAPADKSQAKGASWDISHLNVVPIFLWSLYANRRATGVNFPQSTDIEYISNQYALHVFEGDYKKPLFTNFFDGTDGWFRVSYLGRANYGIAPSRFCNTFDSSHGCIVIGGIYSWSLLAPLNPNIARIQNALIDLARSKDATIACFQPQCFRERYYRYADSSFSFLDSEGRVQYPPALVIILSETVVSLQY